MRTPVISDVVSGVVDRLVEKDNYNSEFVDAVKDGLVSDYRVQFFVQGDFTTAVMFTRDQRDDDRVTFVGTSKRNPEDRPNGLRGKALALSRAVKDAAIAEFERLSEATSARAGLVSVG